MMSMLNSTNETEKYLELLKHLRRLHEEMRNWTNVPEQQEEFYEVPWYIVMILAILYGSISIIAVVGNGLVICVVIKDKRMMTVTNVLIANLALSDILLGMFTTPFQFHPALLQRWDFPDFLCVMAPSFKVLSVIVSVLTLTFISIDRYIAVMYPLKAGFSKSNALIGLVLIWTVAIASSFPEGYFYRVEEIKEVFDKGIRTKRFCSAHWPSIDFGKGYYWYLLCVQYIVPLLVINFAYTRISCRVWGAEAPGERIDRENVRHRTRRKVVRMLIIVVVLFAVCWMPLQLYNVISELKPEINEYRFIKVIWFCSNWLAMSNSCYNPFIYSLLNEKFKRGFKLLFSKAPCCRMSPSLNVNGNEASEEISGGKRITLSYRPSHSSMRSLNTRVGRNGRQYQCYTAAPKPNHAGQLGNSAL